MRRIFESKWFAMASILFVGAFTMHTVQATYSASVDGVGYAVVPKL